MSFEDRYQPLLSKRIAYDDVVVGSAYVIHARNGGVGVALREDGRLGYRLAREKLGRHSLFIEWDWLEDPRFGTAIPLKRIPLDPPSGRAELLAWLQQQESEHRGEIDAAWETVLGFSLAGLRR